MNYFTDKELQCPCCKITNMDSRFLEKINRARHISQVPYVVNSACRCKKHNKKVGGSLTSSHLFGNVNRLKVKTQAMDIKITDSNQLYKIQYGLHDAGFERFFVYCRIDFDGDGSTIIVPKHIHVDNDPTKPPRIFKIKTYGVNI